MTASIYLYKACRDLRKLFKISEHVSTFLNKDYTSPLSLTALLLIPHYQVSLSGHEPVTNAKSTRTYKDSREANTVSITRFVIVKFFSFVLLRRTYVKTNFHRLTDQQDIHDVRRRKGGTYPVDCRKTAHATKNTYIARWRTSTRHYLSTDLETTCLRIHSTTRTAARSSLSRVR